MRRLGLMAFAAVAAASCFVGTLDLTGLACDESHPCTSGYACVSQTCRPAGSGTSGGTGGVAGSCPVCTDGGVLLCDGGLVSCPDGTACDYGACLPACQADGGCGAGALCDLTPRACVPANACSAGSCLLPGGRSGVCLAGVCSAAPPAGGASGTGCTPPDGGFDGGLLLVNGIVATFPGADASADNGLAVQGRVTFTSQSGAASPAPSDVTLSAQQITVFTTQLTPGVWTATVTAPGVALPTIFPDIEIRPPQLGSQIALSLLEVVPVGLAGSVAPGHVVWVGRAGGCGAQIDDYVGGYTVGLSPAAPSLEYYGTTPGLGAYELDPTLGASTVDAGEFLAADAPMATTQYVMAIAGEGAAPPQILLSGSFTPPPQYAAAGQTIAVALLYPRTFP